jgi:hypothetical protein
MTLNLRLALRFLLLLVVVALSGCASTKRLEELRVQVDAKRAKLATMAEPYRIKNVDFAVEVEKAPLESLIYAYNNLPGSARKFEIRSYDRSRYLKYHKWFKCPWPLNGNASWYIRLAFDEALLAHLELGQFNINGWAAGTGLDFSIKASMDAVAGAVGYIDNCLWETPVTAIGVYGAASETFRGHMVPIVDGSGAGFQIKVNSPSDIKLDVLAYVTGIGVIPLWLNLDPLEKLGTIKVENIVGEEGQIENKLANTCRAYKLHITMTQAELLQAGLSVRGNSRIVWEAPGACKQ